MQTARSVTSNAARNLPSGHSDRSKATDVFLAEKKRIDQRKRERDRIRAEHERTRQKEKELRQAEEERQRVLDLEKFQKIQEKREAAVAAKFAARVSNAEHQARILKLYQAEVRQKNAKRASIAKQLDLRLLEGLENRSKDDQALDEKGRALRRVFVILDVNQDGIISQADVRTRLASFGCKLSKSAVAKMLNELEEVFGEEATGSYKQEQYWKWAAFMHQPTPGEFIPVDEISYSRLPDIGSISHPSLATGEVKPPTGNLRASGLQSKDGDEAVLRLYKPPASQTHLNEIRGWTEQWPHRIVTADCADACTMHEAQNPPTMSPREPLDLAPQDAKAEKVSRVVLTEAGLMTETDWKAHILKTRERKDGLCWTNFRDCFLTFSFQYAKSIPVTFFSIVEFLMVDRHGHGTASLEDSMELLFRRFGVPSDAMFTKLFGNSCDPHHQLPLPVYLDKVKMMTHMKQSQMEAEVQEKRRESTSARRASIANQAGGLSRLPSCHSDHSARMPTANPTRKSAHKAISE